MSKFTILLDMDEVLVDFIGGVARLFGVTRKRLERHAPKESQDVVVALAVMLNRSHEDCEQLMWDRINKEGRSFWSTLQPMPYIEKLLEVVGESFYIVTSPSNCISAYSGKAKWIQHWFGDLDWADRLVVTKHKHLLAREDRILIDDNRENVGLFSKHGGRAILFPGYGNYLHDTLDKAHYVRRELMKIRGE